MRIKSLLVLASVLLLGACDEFHDRMRKLHEGDTREQPAPDAK